MPDDRRSPKYPEPEWTCCIPCAYVRHMSNPWRTNDFSRGEDRS